MADRHRMFADCLAVVLEMRRCDLLTATLRPGQDDTQHVLAEIRASRPGAAVVNTDLGPRCDAVEVMASLAASGIGVIAVADVVDEAHWGHCLASGARTVIPKSAGLSGLVSAIRRLRDGQRVLDLSDRERLLRAYVQRDARERERRVRLGTLSSQERAVLQHLMTGLTVREVATLRVVSEATVRTQVKAILRKLRVGSQLSAVALAVSAGWESEAAVAGTG